MVQQTYRYKINICCKDISDYIGDGTIQIVGAVVRTRTFRRGKRFVKAHLKIRARKYARVMIMLCREDEFPEPANLKYCLFCSKKITFKKEKI